MELSQEDKLRLNVMLRQKLTAVRINESEMKIYALSHKGEIKLALNPTCAPDKYLRMVREMLSTYVLGTPGGYPVYLKRWTRTGQMRDESLQGLLLLGEPEAVVAVAHAPGLTEDIARDVWWILPSSEVARKMLENKKVAQSDFAAEMAEFIVEFLPFESEHGAIVDSVKMVLQPGLISEEVRESLWRKAARKSAIFVGFLLATPDSLPQQKPAHPNLSAIQNQLSSDDWSCKQLLRSHSAAGQTFWLTVENTLSKLSSPDVAVSLFNALDSYFHDLPWRVDQISTVEQWQTASDQEWQRMSKSIPTAAVEQSGKIKSLIILALISEDLLNPIFAQTDAVGSVMRKKLKHVTDIIQTAIINLKS